MSTLVLSACWKMADLMPSEKLVLISLADQANDDGVCWPGVGSIARRTCLSERSVQRALQLLENRQLLARIPRPGTSTVYRIHFGEEGGDKVTPRQDVTPPPSPRHPTPVTVSPEGRHPDTQTIIEPSENRQGTRRPPPKAPDWIPAKAWSDFTTMRNAKRAPLTAKAAALIIGKLEKFRAAGDDPGEILEQSIERGWTTVYPLKRESLNAAKNSAPKHQAGRELGRAFLRDHG